MALVAYDFESESEDEDQIPDSSPITIDNVKTEDKTSQKELNKDQEIENISVDANDIPEILSHLPQTKTSTQTLTEDTLEEFVPKYQPEPTKQKKSQKVKITIPSLSDFKDDEDEPEQKKRKTPTSSSGLLSILPPVKGTMVTSKSFIPNILKNKKLAPAKAKTSSMVPHAVHKKAEIAKIKKIAKESDQGDDVESDDDIETPETFNDEMWQKVCGRRTKPKTEFNREVEQAPNMPLLNIAPEPVKPYDGLDNAAFKELVGKSKRPMNIKLIDINEEEILSEKDLWLTKSLTDPDTAPKPVVEDPVDPTRKKKHHITYLAEQAKANEQELQSQWSANKYTRNQTRAKYGF